MNKYPCQYSIVRFAPFAETGEFANVGLVLFVPTLGQLYYRLAPGRFKRVSQFFDQLEAGLFPNALRLLREELDRLTQDLPRIRGQDLSKQIFADFVRRQTGFVHFSEMRVILAEDPEATTEKLYQYYVGRSFNTREYRETELQREFKAIFKQFELERYYREANIDAGLVQVPMPFVHFEADGTTPKAAIKPLAFDQKHLNKQVEHADIWYSRALHMLDANIKAETILYAIDWQSVKEPKMRAYLKQYEKKVRKLGIFTIAANDRQDLITFAKRHA